MVGKGVYRSKEEKARIVMEALSNSAPLSVSMAVENFPESAVEYFPPIFRFSFIHFSPHSC